MNPQVLEQLLKLAERGREELGDSLTKTTGKGLRPAGMISP